MTTTNRTRKRQLSRLGSLLAVLMLAVMLAPEVSAGMQKLPESRDDSTPIILDEELRDKINSMPRQNDEQGHDDTGTLGIPEADERTGGEIVDAEFGFTVEFPGPWSHTGTYDEEGVTTEYLEIRGEQGGIYVTAYEWTGDYTVREYIEWWATSEYTESWLPGGEALRYLSSGPQGAVIHISEPTEEYPERWVYVTELHEFDDFVVEIVHFAPVSFFEESYTSVAGNLTADGRPVLGLFTYEEIVALLPDA